MSAVTFSKTCRGGDILTFEGYDYLSHEYTPNLWRCTQGTCLASMTYIDGVVTLRKTSDHNHSPNELVRTVQEEMEGAVVKEPTSKKRRTGSWVQVPASVEDESYTEFPMALLPKEESPSQSFPETPKYPTAKRGGIHGTSGRASQLTAPSSSTANGAVEGDNSAQQIISSVRVGTFEEDRFMQYVGGVLGMVDPVHKRRYMQAIKYTISKLDVDIANSDPELQPFLS